MGPKMGQGGVWEKSVSFEKDQAPKNKPIYEEKGLKFAFLEKKYYRANLGQNWPLKGTKSGPRRGRSDFASFTKLLSDPKNGIISQDPDIWLDAHKSAFSATH